MKTYFNTTKLSGRELRLAIAAASRQKDKIMIFMKANRHKSFTPPEVHMHVFDESTPITSTRRSLTDLAKEGYLTMSATAERPGLYNANNHTWKFKKSL